MLTEQLNAVSHTVKTRDHRNAEKKRQRREEEKQNAEADCVPTVLEVPI